MDQTRLLILVLLALVNSVWCQTKIEITKTEVVFKSQTNAYLEGATEHTISFDLAITLGPGEGANDAKVNRWQLLVELVTSGGSVVPAIGPFTLKRGDGLNPSQADLRIDASSTGTMRNVQFTFDPSALPDSGMCPDDCVDDDLITNDNYRLKVTVQSPDADYTIEGAAGVNPFTYINDVEDAKLSCRGAILSVVPHIVTGLPIIENTYHKFVFDIIVTSDANSRSVLQIDSGEPADLWDLTFTLEKYKYDPPGDTSPENIVENDCDVIETGAAVTFTDTDVQQELRPGGSITFTNVHLGFALTAPHSCDEFDKLCVELEPAPAPADADAPQPPLFTFTGSGSVNLDVDNMAMPKYPKTCVDIVKPQHCNGVLITDVAVGLVETEVACQGNDNNDPANQIDMTMTVKLHEDSAPLNVATITGAGVNLWTVFAFGSTNSNCTGETIEAAETSFNSASQQFNNLKPGEQNVFPQFTADFNLVGWGCPQIKYICVQLFRNEGVATNADFTYEFLRGDRNGDWVSSIIINPPRNINTDPPSSQWGSTEIHCQGVSLVPTSLTMDRQNLGEYTKNNRIDFEAIFTEGSTAANCGPDGMRTCNCGVQGSDLWELEVFLTRNTNPNLAREEDVNGLLWEYPYVEAVDALLVEGEENQAVVDAGTLTFNDVRVNLDLSNLDCQEGPFYLCALLKKSPNATQDFLLENADSLANYMVCSTQMPCVGVHLDDTILSEASTPSSTNFPLRQGVDTDYLIDVKVTSDVLAGSIRPDPTPSFTADGTTVRSAYDLWDFNIFLSDDGTANGAITDLSFVEYDDRERRYLEDLELQAGQTATFESVEVQLDLTEVQCMEFSHLCVEVFHGATHDQCGVHTSDENYNPGLALGPDVVRARAPTVEAGADGDFYTVDNALFSDVTCNDPLSKDFFAEPNPRPVSDNLDCILVECRGVKFIGDKCDLSDDTTTVGGNLLVPGDIQEGASGSFRLELDVYTDDEYGAVSGDDLWKMTVFLSPDPDGATVTVEKEVQSSRTSSGWEDLDVVPGNALSFDVVTPEFTLNYPCPQIRYICVKLEKGNSPTVGVDTPPTADFKLEDPNPYITCKVLDGCGGVLLDEVQLALNANSRTHITEKQNDNVNELLVDVNLVFNEQSANFANGSNFWDLEFFLAADDLGNDIVDSGRLSSTNDPADDFNSVNGAVVGFGDPNVAGRTTSLLLDSGDPIDPQFNLDIDGGVVCIDGDTDPHLYLCVIVKKNDDVNTFTLSPESRQTCIRIDCQGVVFDTPVNFAVNGGPILEVTEFNELEVSVDFPIVNNGGRIEANYPSDLWKFVIFLSENSDGSGTRISEVEVPIDEGERRQATLYGVPVDFNNKDLFLNMYDKLCPPGQLWICAQLEELPDADPDCTIDTSAAITCRAMGCRGVEFTDIDYTLENDICLVEHESENLVEFEFSAGTADGSASVSPGSDMWLMSAYASVDPQGNGINLFGLTEIIFETALTAGDTFEIDNINVQMNLEDFICPPTQLYLCVQLERNDDAEPKFTVTSNPAVFRICKPIECKGVKITSLELLDISPNSVTERSGEETIETNLRVVTDADYAGIEGENLWSIRGELRDANGEVIDSATATLTQAQRNQGLLAGATTTFNDLALTFDLDRDVPCPDNEKFVFCVIIDKGDRLQGLSPDFSIDEKSQREKCSEIACRGVCIHESTATAINGVPLQEGVSNHDVWLDLNYYTRADYAGVDEQNAIDLWKVNIFASSDPSGTNRLAQTIGTLAANNANYPVSAGGTLTLNGVYGELDFSGSGTYLTCSDIQYICGELQSGDNPEPDFSLFGCPSSKLVACARPDCRGVVLENVGLNIAPGVNPSENDQAFMVNFDVTLTPHEETSILPDGGSNYWQVEIFGSNADASEDPSAEEHASTIAIIPLGEQDNGIDRPDNVGDDDTTLAGLQATMDLRGTYCGDLDYLCVKVSRSPNAQPLFTLDGIIGDIDLIGCVNIDCDGVAITNATLINCDPEVVAEGNPNWLIEYDATFETEGTGGGVFGSNLWRIATWLAYEPDGSRGVYDEDDSVPNVIYPVLTGGSQSQTLQPENPLGFQNVRARFDTRGFACQSNTIYFCIRLEKDEERSSSEFTLSSPEADRTECKQVECKGVVVTQLDFATDRTIITEREEDQQFVFDIIASTHPDGGSTSGENLWQVYVYFNDQEDGMGNDFSSPVEAVLSADDANRAVSAGSNILLDDVAVDVSAAEVLCGDGTVYLCISLSRHENSEPAFTLQPDPVRKCKNVTCNPVIISRVECKLNAPEYLLENVVNTLNFELSLTSHGLSASIYGDNLWTVPKVYLTDKDYNELLIEENEWLNPESRNRDLEGGNSLSLSDIQTSLVPNGQICEIVEYACFDFGKNPSVEPDFTLDFQGTEEPPYCKPIECIGVYPINTELELQTQSIYGRSGTENILFSFTLYTDPGGASVSGDDLWEVHVGFVDSEYNELDGWANDVVLDLPDQNFDLIAGVPLQFTNLLAANLPLNDLLCPDDGLYFCVTIARNPIAAVDFTLYDSGTNENPLHDCQYINCQDVLIEETTIDVTAGLEISETAPSASHIINFEFDAKSFTTSRSVTGNSLWQIGVFGSRHEDGSGQRFLQDTLTLSASQRDQNLINGGDTLSFPSLAATLDTRAVRCIDFQYFCAQLEIFPDNPPRTVDFALQGYDSDGRDDDILIACQKMDCVGAYLTDFEAVASSPVVLRENANGQVYILDAFLKSDPTQESVNGANLWGLRAFFNPSPDCQAIDDDGNQMRIQETEVTIYGGEDDQHLPAGGEINFNDVRAEIDYPGTCEPFEDEIYLCLEVIRSPLAVPAFTLLGNTLYAVPATCRGVEVLDTTIVSAFWEPAVFIERFGSNRRKRQAETLTFDLDVVVETDGDAAGVDGSGLWEVFVYLSGDEDCLTWHNDTLVEAVLEPAEANQDLSPGASLSFNLEDVEINVENVLCEHARYVCAHLGKGDNPDNDFTLTDVPTEESLVGSWPLDCRGVRIIDSELHITAGLPVIAGSPNHQLVFSFTINTDPNGAGITGTDLFTLYIYGNDQIDGFGQIPNGDLAAYLQPISQELTLIPGVSHSFDFLPARLNLLGVSCEEIPYVCVQIYRGALPDPHFTLQPDSPLDPVFTDCVEVACTGLIVEDLELEFTAGLPLLEDAAAHSLHFIITPSASQHGGSAVGTNLWEADIFISSNPDGLGEKYALTEVIIVNPDENLNRGDSADILANAVLDLSGVVCTNVQYICVDLYKGEEANPDFTLSGTTRVCQGFICKGVDFINPGLIVETDSVLRMLTPNTHVGLTVYVDTTLTSSTVTGENLFKVTVFANAAPDGSGPRYGEAYGDVSYAGDVNIVAGQRTVLNDVQVYLDLSGVYCSELRYVCAEIWRGDYANPYYQIDSPASQAQLRVCQQVACYGVQIQRVTPHLTLGSPLIENARERNTWINIQLDPSHNSASIIGDNLWKATCFANSEADGSGIRYSLQNAILQQSELDKDLVYSNIFYSDNPEPTVLENAVVSMDYSGRRCNEIQYVCCTIGENEYANPDFNLQGAYGNNNLLTGCYRVPCLGVGITSTRLTLDSNQILQGDESHTFSGDLTVSFWRESRAIQEDDTWQMSAYVKDLDGSYVASAPVYLIQAQQDYGVVPGTDLTFGDLEFEVDLSNLECSQISQVCVQIGMQNGVDFTLQGVTESGEEDDYALTGCSPTLRCGDFSVDIQVSDFGERHIELEWNQGEGDFDTYVITYSPEESIVTSPQYVPRHLRAPLRFDGLRPGQEYTFNLYLYKGGQAKAGPDTEIQRTKPAAVDVSINRQTNSELHVQWTEADGVYDTYRVELYPQGTPPTPIFVDAAQPRELIFSGLREARAYTVTIYTLVGGRQGYRSDPAYASETTQPAPPFFQLASTETGTTYVDVEWIPPTGYLVAGYKLESIPDEEGNSLPHEVASDVHEYRIPELAPGREYEFHLTAFALVDGEKLYSIPSYLVARTKPEAVDEVEVELSTTTTITFEWEAPDGDADSYQISNAHQVGAPQTISSLLPRRYTASGLDIATSYEFTIVTVSGGLYSEPFIFGATTRPNRPGPIRTQEVDTDRIHIAWDHAEGPREGYEVHYSPAHASYQPPSPFFTTSNEFTLNGLHPHTTVDFEVVTVSNTARSDPSIWRQRTYPDLPGPVQYFHVEPSGASSVVLRFSQPEYPNGVITAYMVTYKGRKPGVLGIDSGLLTITALPNEADFEQEILQLRSGYTYSFTIRAANSEGQGDLIEYDGVTLIAGLPIFLKSTFPDDFWDGLYAGSHSIEYVPVDASIFSDINGEIIGFSVLVVEDEAFVYNQTAPDHPPTWYEVQPFAVWVAYQTSEIFTIDSLYGTAKRSTYDFGYYTIGDEDDCNNQPSYYYCNGPLHPLTVYRVAVRAHTEAGYAQTTWSHRVVTKADRWWFAYAAIPFLLVVLVIAIILALCACSAAEKKTERRPKYAKDYYRDDFTDYGAEAYTSENVNMNASGSTIFMIPSTGEPPIPGPGTLENKKLNPTHVLGTRPIQINKFQIHVEAMAANSAAKFVEEYENLRPIGDDLARLIGGLPENKDKNRFSNILPYDYNRVQLTEDTYINASFIGGFNSRHEYIATQGPLGGSVEDFWRMVWENNCPTMVMMGRCIEDGHVKSEQYWPEADFPVTYDNMTITMVSEKVGEEWTVRDFTIQSGSEIRAVRQFNFTAWPNHGVPETTEGVVRFISTVRAEAPQHSGPMVIHCGAGIGRTGIFLSLDILMQGLVYDETTVDVYGTVSNLRKQRCCMVQTVHQYIFLHKAMLDILQGKAQGYNWLLRTRKGSVGSRDSDQVTSDTL